MTKEKGKGGKKKSAPKSPKASAKSPAKKDAPKAEKPKKEKVKAPPLNPAAKTPAAKSAETQTPEPKAEAIQPPTGKTSEKAPKSKETEGQKTAPEKESLGTQLRKTGEKISKKGKEIGDREVHIKSPALPEVIASERPPQDLHPNIIISGYYGFDNLGDELILRVLVDELKRDHNEIVVLSQNPAKTAKEYGVRAIHRTNLIDIIDALSRAHLFISGGGGLFQDATGPASAVYYGGLIHLASYFEVPVVFWGQGVGPLKSDFARMMTRTALSKTEYITVRDEASANLVDELIGLRPEITSDPVWLLKPSDKRKKEEGFYYIGVSLRPWPDFTPARLKAFADMLGDFAASAPKKARFLLFPFQKKEDLHLLKKLEDHLQGPQATAAGTSRRFDCEIVPPDQVLSQITECDVLFGMRFHSLILGLLNDVPVYGLIYDPKVSSLLGQLGLQGTDVAQMEALRSPDVQSHFDQYPKVDLTPLKSQARRNFEVLGDFTHLPLAELIR